jgi:HK97 family phage portal protein
MKIKTIANKVKSLFGFGGGMEGSYRGPALGISEFGNGFPVSFGDGYQQGTDIATGNGARMIPVVYSCVMAEAKAMSQCYAHHKRINEKGEHVIVETSPASRVLRKPNAYQTWPQFVLNAIATELFEGEAFILKRFDDRGCVISFELLQPGTCSPYINKNENGENVVYYSVGSSPMDLIGGGSNYMVPSREILHLRRYCPRSPLIGESPIRAAALAMNINVSLNQTQALFFKNANRASGILTVDDVLDAEQMEQLRIAFDKSSKAWQTGGTPILGAGVKYHNLSVTSVDAQAIESMRMSIEECARVFGCPLPIIGDLSRATFNNSETLINMWLSMGLGYALENFERSLDDAFNLPANEYIELDVSSLMRADMTSRITALQHGITAGIFTINEARAREGLRPVTDGDEPLIQAQMQGLGAWKVREAQKPIQAPQMLEPAQPPEDNPEIPADQSSKDFDSGIVKAMIFEKLHKGAKNVH